MHFDFIYWGRNIESLLKLKYKHTKVILRSRFFSVLPFSFQSEYMPVEVMKKRNEVFFWPLLLLSH